MNAEKISNIFALIVMPIWFITLLIYSANADYISPLWLTPVLVWFIFQILAFDSVVRTSAKAEADIVKEYIENKRKESRKCHE